ncbi:MAG: hypothetical protein Q8P61_06275 [Candidatus Nanopelagicales bacterium]|nr:hypothetical protein [Candidatus Nanopelagicales bacterium]
MPDRLAYSLGTAITSNTGGPFTATWDRAPVVSAGTIRSVVAVSPSITSNARFNQVDVYLQSDAPSAGSNTAVTVLVDPITLLTNNDAVVGTIRHASARVAVGDQLQLRTYMDNTGATPGGSVFVTVLVEPDA